MVPRDFVIVYTVAVGLQILSDIVTVDRRMVVRRDIGLVVTGGAFDVHEDRVEFIGVGGEPGGVLGGRDRFTAERTHVVGSPTEDDHLWDCFVAEGFMFGGAEHGRWVSLRRCLHLPAGDCRNCLRNSFHVLRTGVGYRSGDTLPSQPILLGLLGLLVN